MCVRSEPTFIPLKGRVVASHCLWEAVNNFDISIFVSWSPSCLFVCSQVGRRPRQDAHGTKTGKGLTFSAKRKWSSEELPPESVVIQWKSWRARLSYSKHLFAIKHLCLYHFWSISDPFNSSWAVGTAGHWLSQFSTCNHAALQPSILIQVWSTSRISPDILLPGYSISGIPPGILLPV